MGIVYNKKLVTKDRSIMPTGPRDRQRKHNSDALLEIIADLRAEIKELRNKLGTMPTTNSTGEYTVEQVNEEIEKAVKDETKKLRLDIADLKNKLLHSKEEVKDLRLSLKEERDYIKQLKSVTGSATVESSVIERRPEIRPVYVDPIEEVSEVSTKKFKAETVVKNNNGQLADKVSKLKNLLGKK